jgi:hypothetical protein
MKRLLTVSLLVVLFLTGLNNLQAQTQRILLEQHTGAWCGWCVDGSYIMDQLQEEYPDQVIGVKWHNGDAMAIPTQGQLGQALGLTGFPTGSISRTAFSDGQGGAVIMLSRGAWKQASEIVMNQEPLVDVKILAWSYNQQTNEVSVTLEATVLQDISNQLAFEALVCENNLSGPNSSAWNQANYLSGRAGYEDNPYYNQPNPIVGYVHEKVVRMQMAADIFGDVGSFPATVSAGSKYTHTMKKTLPNVQGDPINMDNVFIVGFVANKVLEGNATVQILNAVTNEVNLGSVALAMKNSESSSAVVDPSSQHTFNLTVTNKYDEGRDFDISLQDVPEGWTATLSKSKINLLPDASADISVTVTSPAQAAAADFGVYVVASEESSVNKKQALRVVNNNIVNMVVDYTGTTDYAGFITQANGDYDPLVSVQFTEFKDNFDAFQMVESIVWSCGGGAPFSSEALTLINFSMNSGIKTVIEGDVPLFDQSASTLMNNLGISLLGQYKGEVDQKYNLEGVAGDPITDGWTAVSEIKQYWTSGFSIKDASKTSAIVKYKNESDTLAGVKVKLNNNKAVVLGFSTETIKDQNKKNQLINNVMDWLFAEAGDGAMISADKTVIDFGSTDVAVTETVTFSNDGDENLLISSATIEGDSDTKTLTRRALFLVVF